MSCGRRPARGRTTLCNTLYCTVLARLAGSPAVAAGIISGSGLDRLVELSVCKKARLDSDSTLVAVITAVSAKHRLSTRCPALR